MSHLSPSEFVDLADGTLLAARAAHVNGCDACRAQAEIVRDALRLTEASAPVPEPSPLFWDQLSARVRDEISAAPRRSRFGFGLRGFQPEAAMFALAIVLVVVAVVIPGVRRAGAPAQVAMIPQVAPGDGQAVELTLDPDHREAWAVLTAAAEDLQLDDARDAGMGVPATAVDRAVTQLTRDELSELGRLLQSELTRTSSGS